MFKLEQQPPAYWWPVKVMQPLADKPGEFFEAGRFEVKFPWWTEAQIDAWSNHARENGLLDRKAAEEIILGLRGVADQDGEELDCTPDNVARLLAEANVGTSVVRAFMRSRAEAAQKN